MKTILYNPIFINPQAYYVFPRLTRYLQPDNESTAEPANYIGTIEVKVIAYGDTTLKRTYTNTDSIDLSEFKNTWIRISLFTKVGSCVLGEWKIGNMESDLPYIDPEVLASLKAVVIVGNKTNNDSDRAIVKNLVDPDNPFVISNAAFKLNSGFGKYGMDFLEWKANSGMNFTSTKLTSTKPNLPGGWLTFRNVSGLISETKVKVSGAPKEFVFIGNNNGADDKFSVTINNGVYTIPEFTLSSASGFYINNNSGDWSNLVIEQIPSFEGAFVTDGIDDLIKSTKSATEMLDGSNEVTVVSMIHQIKTNDDTTRNNWFFTPVSYLENRVVKDKIGKTGIYGYTSTNVTNAQISDITPILGDKNDYTLYSKIEDGDRDYDTNENKVPAYRARNIGGNTYIDGILNEYIYASQLQNITHNIVELYDPELNIGTLNPKIGSSYLNSNYAQMSLYDFMLFDNISTDDKIKQLNEYVGIEGNTEWRKTK